MNTEGQPPSFASPDAAARTRPRQWLPIGLIALAVLAVPVLLVAMTLASTKACACSPTPTAPINAKPSPDITSPVDGVVIAVDSAGLGDVRGFTLRPTNGGGFAFGFTLGALANATEFSPSHLAEHMASSQAVRVWFRTQNGVRTVYRLEDAP